MDRNPHRPSLTGGRSRRASRPSRPHQASPARTAPDQGRVGPACLDPSLAGRSPPLKSIAFDAALDAARSLTPDLSPGAFP